MMSSYVGSVAAEENILPLDYVPDSAIAGAWSFRKLRSNYGGYLARVLRSSDQQTTDVAQDTKQVFSLNSTVAAGGNLGTWIGSDTGYVESWYDQSVNNNTAFQLTLGNEPIVISSGTVNLLSGRATAIYTGNSFLTANDSMSLNPTSAFTIFCVCQFTGFGILDTIVDKRDSTMNFAGYTFYMATNLSGMQWNTTTTGTGISSSSATIGTGIPYILSTTAIFNSTANLYESNTLVGNGTLNQPSGTVVNTADLDIGGHAGSGAGFTLIGDLSELIILNISVTDQQRLAITNNMRNFYSIS